MTACICFRGFCCCCCSIPVNPVGQSPLKMERSVQTVFTISKRNLIIEKDGYKVSSLKEDSKNLDEISLRSTVVFSMAPESDHFESTLTPTMIQRSKTYDPDGDDQIDARVRSMIKVQIKENPLQVIQILNTKIEIPEEARSRHIYSCDKSMTEHDAIVMAQQRDPRIKKTTIFEDTSEFFLCSVQSKYGLDQMVISKDPVRTFHCIFDHSVWIPFYLGKFFAIFVDAGKNFPGFIAKKVNFEVIESRIKTPDVITVLEAVEKDDFMNLENLDDIEFINSNLDVESRREEDELEQSFNM